MTYKPLDSEINYPEINALAEYLDIDANDITRSNYDDSLLEADGNEYYCLTDDEANDKALERITESLWAFNASFILEQCELPYELEPSFKTWQCTECESCNDALERLIDKTCGLQDFANAAISADGRGHFISQYDGNENEQKTLGACGIETYYIYRVN